MVLLKLFSLSSFDKTPPMLIKIFGEFAKWQIRGKLTKTQSAKYSPPIVFCLV